MTERYWLQRGTNPEWIEVDRAEWIRAEREAGFFPKGLSRGLSHHWDVCATAGFSHSTQDPKNWIAGKITRDEGMPNAP